MPAPRPLPYPAMADVSFEQAKAATKALKHRALRIPEVVDLPVGNISPADLPLTEMPAIQASVKWFVDIVTNIDGPVDKEAITKAAVERRFLDLPEPYNLATNPQMHFDYQLFIIPQNNGQFCAVKHVVLGAKVKGEFVMSLARGTVHMILWGGATFMWA